MLPTLPRTSTPPTIYVLAVGPALALLAFATLQPWVPVEQLFRDIFIAAGRAGDECCRPYLGFISNIGALVWCATGAISLFAGVSLLENSGRSPAAHFLILGAIMTFVLLADDFFMMHEQVYPELFNAGERAIFLAYGLLLIAYSFAFRREIIEVDPYLYAFALGCFGLSGAIDQLWDRGAVLQRLTEDGPKLIGITAWAAFFTRASWVYMKQNLKTHSPPMRPNQRVS